MSMDVFDMVEINDEPYDVEIVDPKSSDAPTVSEHIGHAVADNFQNIISIANNIVEIKKMQVQSDAVIAKLNAETEKLRSEAENYVKMKGADTRDVVEKMNALRCLINDINSSPNNNIPPEVLSELLRITLEKK